VPLLTVKVRVATAKLGLAVGPVNVKNNPAPGEGVENWAKQMSTKNAVVAAESAQTLLLRWQ
jgi:hypothetical protein